MSVYCVDCKHLIAPQAIQDSVGITYTDYNCGHTSNIVKSDCWMCSDGKTTYMQKPNILNASNTCANHEVAP